MLLTSEGSVGLCPLVLLTSEGSVGLCLLVLLTSENSVGLCLLVLLTSECSVWLCLLVRCWLVPLVERSGGVEEVLVENCHVVVVSVGGVSSGGGVALLLEVMLVGWFRGAGAPAVDGRRRRYYYNETNYTYLYLMTIY